MTINYSHLWQLHAYVYISFLYLVHFKFELRLYAFHIAKMVITDTKQTTIIENYMTEYKDSLWKKSSLLLDYIEDWTRLNQYGLFEEQ